MNSHYKPKLGQTDLVNRVYRSSIAAIVVIVVVCMCVFTLHFVCSFHFLCSSFAALDVK